MPDSAGLGLGGIEDRPTLRYETGDASDDSYLSLRSAMLVTAEELEATRDYHDITYIITKQSRDRDNLS